MLKSERYPTSAALVPLASKGRRINTILLLIAMWLCGYVAILNLVPLALSVDAYESPGPICLEEN